MGFLAPGIGWLARRRSQRRGFFSQALTTLLILPALLAGCSDEEQQTGTTKPYAQVEAKPGAGVRVTAARANWDSGYFEAEIVAALPAVASRLVHFWANGWFPLQNAKLKTALPTRGIVGDLASPVGTIVADGALLGYFIDKPTAEQHGITSMTDLKRPEIAALFDRDTNGKADLIGCNAGWGCATFINDQIKAQGWQVEQVQGDYPRLFDDIVVRVKQGLSLGS